MDFSLNNPSQQQTVPLRIYSHYQNIGRVDARTSPSLQLPIKGIKFLHIHKAYAPQGYSDNNVIYVRCIDKDNNNIISSTAISFAMNKRSELLMLPKGTEKVIFTRAITAVAPRITLFSHYYGV